MGIIYQAPPRRGATNGRSGLGPGTDPSYTEGFGLLQFRPALGIDRFGPISLATMQTPPTSPAPLQPSPVASIIAAAQQRAVERDLPYSGAVTPAEADALLGALPEAKLIDVRTRAEWDYVGRVPGSILVEWNTYPEGTRNPAFLEQLQGAAPNVDAPVLFLCRSGQRSDHAARAARAAGYSRAFNVLEGFEGDKDATGQRGHINGWRNARLPWVQG
jgi:rhodanese-related sulfurtransferase